MKNFRIIPRLDIKNGLLVKGINLEGLRVLGNPFDFAKKYYLDGADEICYVDIVSSLYGTKNLSKFIKKHSNANQATIYLQFIFLYAKTWYKNASKIFY